MLIIVWFVLSLASAKTEYNTDKPILVKQSNNLTLLTGMTANFDCEFETDLPLLVHWLRPAEVIRNSMNVCNFQRNFIYETLSEKICVLILDLFEEKRIHPIIQFVMSLFFMRYILACCLFFQRVPHDITSGVLLAFMPTLKWLINWYLKPGLIVAAADLLTNCITNFLKTPLKTHRTIQWAEEPFNNICWVYP